MGRLGEAWSRFGGVTLHGKAQQQREALTLFLKPISLGQSCLCQASGTPKASPSESPSPLLSA
jgi:hypothetical protein